MHIIPTYIKKAKKSEILIRRRPLNGGMSCRPKSPTTLALALALALAHYFEPLPGRMSVINFRMPQ